MAWMIDADALYEAMGLREIYKDDQRITSAWGVPVVEAEPTRHGEWIFVEEILEVNMLEHYSVTAHGYECSLCGARLSEEWDYCPGCGAKMSDSPQNALHRSNAVREFLDGVERMLLGEEEPDD